MPSLSQAQAQQLAKLLDMEQKELARRLATDKGFAWVQRQVPPEVADRIAALKLPGIYQNREYPPLLPTGDMTAHIVGFTGVGRQGAGRRRAGVREKPDRTSGQP